MEAGGVHGDTSAGSVETAVIETMKGDSLERSIRAEGNVSLPVRGSRGANWTAGSLRSSCFLRRD